MELRHSGQSAVIDTANGAALVDLTLNTPSGKLKVISSADGYLFSSSLLFPFPNRLANGAYTWEGLSYQFPLNDFGQPNALHGFIHDKPFEVNAVNENSISAIYRYDGSLAYYPFPFTFLITYILEDSAITVEVEITNESDKPIPFGFGWHPYFHVAGGLENAEMKLPRVVKFTLDKLGIPTGESGLIDAFDVFSPLIDINLDDSFRIEDQGKQSSFLRFDNETTLEIWQDEQFPYLQIYTPGDRQAVAIEPMTCGVNAWNQETPVPTLRDTFRGSFGLRIL